MNRVQTAAVLRHGFAFLRAKAGRWRVRCPVCGSGFRSFLPAGRRPRANAMCPRCGALERHRLLWLYLRERTDLFARAQRMLHLAPERCLARRLQALPRLEYITADYNPGAASVCTDITSAAFADSSFDAVLCSHVLEHIPDDAAALAELFRILRPGGWAILQVPLDEARERTFEDPDVVSPAERERLFDQADHVRVYGRDYPVRLARAGFDVHADSFAYDLDVRAIRAHALLPETIFVCRRAGAA
jgi:SAM-dependent methyltransferase